MPTYKKKCFVEGCTDRKSPRFNTQTNTVIFTTTTNEIYFRHRFPVKDKKLLNIWIERVGNTKIKEYSDKTISNRCYVCSAHFIEECLTKYGLIRKSLPTINVPGI